MDNYIELLKNPKWQKKRLEIFNRDNFTCTCCGDKESELHVHHLKYNGKPWDIDNKYLKTLCCDCHAYISKNEHIDFKCIYTNTDCKIYDIDGKIFLHCNESKSCIIVFTNESKALEAIINYKKKKNGDI